VDELDETIEVFYGDLSKVSNGFFLGKDYLQLRFAGQSNRRSD
jgi:hypothetical protein